MYMDARIIKPAQKNQEPRLPRTMVQVIVDQGPDIEWTIRQSTADNQPATPLGIRIEHKKVLITVY